MMNYINITKAAEQYKNAQPFKHIVIHNAIDEKMVDLAEQEFPSVRDVQSVVYANPLEIKNITSGRSGIGSHTNTLIDYLNSPQFLNTLQAITGIERKLIADPKLMGGGLHESGPGGLLKIHVDFNKHYETGYDRRLNVLLYLNKDWKPEYGGAVELWNREMREDGPVVKVLPTFNTMVIFNTDEYSFHGLPDAITCPQGMKRKSLALYYYTDGRPAEELNPEHHNSVWKARLHADGTVFEADKDVDRLANHPH